MLKVLIAVILPGLFLISCNNGNPFEKVNDFDQKPLLENIGHNLILPAYEALVEANSALANAVYSFVESPTASTLAEARIQLKSARMGWQRCTPYQFGPAEMHGLSAELNIYPVDQNQIELNVSSGDYDLSAFNNSDAKGYPALGFLLYGEEISDNEISSMTENKGQYLKDIVDRITETTNKVYSDWTMAEGNYISTFTSEDALGVNIGSSVGKLVNAFNQDFERNTRDGKVGIPVGIRTNGTPVPDRAEAYFAGYSVELLRANLETYQALYLGGEGVGFDDYLKEIGAATTGNEDLSEKITLQLEAILNAANSIGDPLPEAISQDKEKVQELWAEMQALVVLFKTDLASSIGVVISYQDNDGD